MGHLVSDLYTYPVKSLSPVQLGEVTLEAGETFPFDRAYALKRGPWDFDPENPEYKFKTFYHVLMKDERMAGIKSTFDAATGTLFLKDSTGYEASGKLSEPEGRAALELLLKRYLAQEVEILSAPDFSFSDVPMKVVSIINLASVRALRDVVGAELDPIRFRGNIHVDGGAPWSEFDLVSKRFKIGGVTFETVKRIQRCAATNVNLVTATRDQNLPKALMKNFGHADMGIYAKVVEGGVIKTADGIEPL